MDAELAPNSRLNFRYNLGFRTAVGSLGAVLLTSCQRVLRSLKQSQAAMTSAGGWTAPSQFRPGGLMELELEHRQAFPFTGREDPRP